MQDHQGMGDHRDTGMRRMHEQLMGNHPDMARLHERMMSGDSAEMARMHEQMMTESSTEMAPSDTTPDSEGKL